MHQFSKAEESFISYVKRGHREPAALTYGFNYISEEAILECIVVQDDPAILDWLVSLLRVDDRDFVVHIQDVGIQ